MRTPLLALRVSLSGGWPVVVGVNIARSVELLAQSSSHSSRTGAGGGLGGAFLLAAGLGGPRCFPLLDLGSGLGVGLGLP